MRDSSAGSRAGGRAARAWLRPWPKPHGRSGVALILVLAVLAALLLLGLPFLASQTSSQAGARQIAQQGAAMLARDAAEGVAIAQVLRTLHDGDEPAHDLHRQAGRFVTLDENRFAVELGDRLARGAVHAGRASAVVEDENGKLNPNSAGAELWMRLFAAVGIDDYMSEWSFVWSDPTTATAPQPGSWRRRENMGQLAITLARAGLFVPETGERIIDLDQLLICDPARFRSTFAYVPGDPFGGRSVPAASPASGLLRRPLSRAELALLKPYLSVWTRGPGRGGFADAGSVIHYDRTTNQYTFDQSVQVVVPDAWLVSSRSKPGATRLNRVQHGVVWGQQLIANGQDFARPGDGVGIVVPAPINPNNAAKPVLSALNRDPKSVPYVEKISDIFNFARTDPMWPMTVDGPAIGVGRMHAPEHVKPAVVVTVESFGAGQDGAGRRTAGDGRRSVIQVVDQEQGARAAWRTQADWQALAHQLLAPQTITGPQPYARSQDTRSKRSALDLAGYTEAGPFLSMARNTTVRPDWVVGFADIEALPDADLHRSEPRDDRAAGAAAPKPQIDGARLNGMLAYTLSTTEAQNHVLVVRSPDPLAADGGALAGRWLSLMVKFTNTGSPITLFSARAPRGSQTLGVEITTAPGDNESQHRCELVYDPAGPGGSMLRLYLANGAIPHTRDGAEPAGGGRMMGWDDPATPYCDEAALGSGRNSAPFAPADPATVVEVRTRFSPERERWYHLLINLNHDQPGGSAVLIDGCGGRSWHDQGVFDRQGDWYHFPTARLETALTALEPRTTPNAFQVAGDSLNLSTPPGVTIDEVLPSRGLIRIHDEYIAYGSRSGNTLRQVRRAARVNTDRTRQDAEEWPRLQAHKNGSIVVPGWFRFDVGEMRWWRGAAQLTQTLGSGDTATTFAQPHLAPAGWVTLPAEFPTAYKADDQLTGDVVVNDLRYRAWSWLARSQYLSTTAGTIVQLRPSLTLAGARGLWPQRGLVQFYRTSSASSAAGLLGQAWFTCPGGTPATLMFPAVAAPTTLATVVDGSAVFVVVCSIAVDQADNFPPGNSRFHIAQIESPDGRVEWIDYDEIVKPGDVSGTFFTHERGFPFIPINVRASARGNARTAFAGRAELLANALAPFAPGARVLPVQVNSPIYGLEAGDIVTVVPALRWTSATRPVQVAVRFAATDGYPTTPISTPGTDNYNFLFALTDQVPETMPQGIVSTYVGRGWSSGRSLSTAAYAPPRTGSFPRIDAMGSDFTAGDQRFTLGPDRERGGVGNGNDLYVDACAAGRIPSSGFRPGGDGIVDIDINGTAATAIPRTLRPPFTVTASDGIFTRDFGLVWIDGEIMAYRAISGGTSRSGQPLPSQAQAIIIGRGLMGTVAADHSIPLLPGSSGYSPLPAWPLPWAAVGVAQGAGIPAPSNAPQLAQITGLDLTTAIQSGGNALACEIVSSPDGSEVEALRLYRIAAGRASSGRTIYEFRDAPWLRGMYGTKAKAWDGSGGDGEQPIVIGWFPRHASALPTNLPADPDVMSAMLRSRCYQWVGLPLNRQGMRMDAPLSQHRITLDTQGMGIGLGIRGDVRGLAVFPEDEPSQWFDWARRSVAMGLNGSGAWSTPAGKESDGAEWRVHARYQRAGASTGEQGWLDLAEAAAVYLRVSSAAVQAAAPIRILSSQAP